MSHDEITGPAENSNPAEHINHTHPNDHGDYTDHTDHAEHTEHADHTDQDPHGTGGPAADGPAIPTSEPPKARPRRALGLAAAAVAGTLIVGGAGAGIGIAWDRGQASDGTSATASRGAENGQSTSPFGGGSMTIPPGSGGSIFGGLPDNAFDNPQKPSVPAATADQLTGLVRIVSKVDFGAGKAMGTGMVLTSDGEVVTNHHVVAGSTSIRVKVMSTGKVYTATVVGTDAKDDIAVLQLDNATGLTTAPLASQGAQVGDNVVAVGDADGLHRLSAVSGKVTAVRQSITTRSDATTSGERLHGLIEIDADVISGDSGGATLNADGQVIGMTTAASSGTSNITGYAIPIAKVVRIADAIKSGTASARIDLGYPAFLGVQLRGQSTTVAGSVPGTAAATSGIAAGDRITAVDGTAVRTGSALRSAISGHNPGDHVQVSWTDANGTAHTATVTLGDGPVE